MEKNFVDVIVDGIRKFITTANQLRADPHSVGLQNSLVTANSELLEGIIRCKLHYL